MYSFRENGGLNPKKGVLGHFWMTADTKPGVLESSKMSQIVPLVFVMVTIFEEFLVGKWI